MIKTGIIGGSGYVGQNLLKLLLTHNHVDVKIITSSSLEGQKISSIYPELDSELLFSKLSISELNKLDLVFLAVPHGKAKPIASDLSCRIIDMSADHRLTETYGLPEVFKDKIRNSKIVANPGCFATSCILAAYPIKELIEYAVFDCISGYSGGGKDAHLKYDYKDNIIAYKLTDHFHTHEMKKYIGNKLSFTPHVVNTFAGIMCTAHLKLTKDINPDELRLKYKQFYKDSYTSIMEKNKIPESKDVVNTPFCHIGGFKMDSKYLTIISVIDNLMKGAASQAIENMNIMFGFESESGLSGLL